MDKGYVFHISALLKQFQYVTDLLFWFDPNHLMQEFHQMICIFDIIVFYWIYLKKKRKKILVSWNDLDNFQIISAESREFLDIAFI